MELNWKDKNQVFQLLEKFPTDTNGLSKDGLVAFYLARHLWENQQNIPNFKTFGGTKIFNLANRALQLLPDLIIAHLYRGFAAKSLYRSDDDQVDSQMLQFARDSLSLFESGEYCTQNPRALSELAILELEGDKKNCSNAENYYRKALKLDPRHFFSLRGLLALLVRESKWKDAWEIIDTSLLNHSNLPIQVMEDILRCWRQVNGDSQRRLEWFNRNTHGSESWKLLREKALIFDELGDSFTAEIILKDAMQLCPRGLKSPLQKKLVQVYKKNQDFTKIWNRKIELMTSLNEWNLLEEINKLRQEIMQQVPKCPPLAWILSIIIKKLTGTIFRLPTLEIRNQLFGHIDELALVLFNEENAADQEIQIGIDYAIGRLNLLLARSGSQKSFARLGRATIEAQERFQFCLTDEQRSILQRVSENLNQTRSHQCSRIDENKFFTRSSDRKCFFTIDQVEKFLDYVVTTKNLPIGLAPEGSDRSKSPLFQFGPEPTFLLAMTGVGKTVSVPIWELLLCCRQAPLAGEDAERRVYIVAPRIPICESMQAYLNHVYREYLFSINIDPRVSPPLFGCITSVTGRMNPEAPIQFITTGIFELMTTSGEFNPKQHRVVIDEAHVTIPQNIGVEIGIALCRRNKIPLSYMSATVGTNGLAEELNVKLVEAHAKRFPVLRFLFPGKLDRNYPEETKKSLIKIIQSYLLEPSKELFIPPQGADEKIRREYDEVCQALVLTSSQRAMGILVIVNSHLSEQSDTAILANLVQSAGLTYQGRPIEVLRLASQIIRDTEAYKEFRQRVKKVEKEKGRYIIFSTNVVEMGVTFDTIDIVITLDSEIETLRTPYGPLLRKIPLSVNAFFQRAGRTGRVRGGVCFIARDIGAEYTRPGYDLDHMTFESLKYPLSGGDIRKAALVSMNDTPPNEIWQPDKWLRNLPFPSKFREGEAWVKRAAEQMQLEQKELQRRGLATDQGLTPVGKLLLGNKLSMLPDPRYAKAISIALDEKSPCLLQLLVIAAASGYRFQDILKPNIEFRVAGKKLVSYKVLHKDDLGFSIDQLRHCLRTTALTNLTNSQEIPESVKRKLHVIMIDEGYDLAVFKDMMDNPDYLVFERHIAKLCPESELVSVYRIIQYFYNSYFNLQNRLLSRLDQTELSNQAEKEALSLGVSIRVVKEIIGIYHELRKKILPYSTKEEKTNLELYRDALVIFTCSTILKFIESTNLKIPRPSVYGLAKEIVNLILLPPPEKLDIEMIEVTGKILYWLKNRKNDLQKVVETIVKPVVKEVRHQLFFFSSLTKEPLPDIDTKTGKLIFKTFETANTFDTFILRQEDDSWIVENQALPNDATILPLNTENSPLDFERVKRNGKVQAWGTLTLAPKKDEDGQTLSLRLSHITLRES